MYKNVFFFLILLIDCSPLKKKKKERKIVKEVDQLYTLYKDNVNLYIFKGYILMDR